MRMNLTHSQQLHVGAACCRQMHVVLLSNERFEKTRTMYYLYLPFSFVPLRGNALLRQSYLEVGALLICIQAVADPTSLGLEYFRRKVDNVVCNAF